MLNKEGTKGRETITSRSESIALRMKELAPLFGLNANAMYILGHLLESGVGLNTKKRYRYEFTGYILREQGYRYADDIYRHGNPALGIEELSIAGWLLEYVDLTTALVTGEKCTFAQRVAEIRDICSHPEPDSDLYVLDIENLEAEVKNIEARVSRMLDSADDKCNMEIQTRLLKDQAASFGTQTSGPDDSGEPVQDGTEHPEVFTRSLAFALRVLLGCSDDEEADRLMDRIESIEDERLKRSVLVLLGEQVQKMADTGMEVKKAANGLASKARMLISMCDRFTSTKAGEVGDI